MDKNTQGSSRVSMDKNTQGSSRVSMDKNFSDHLQLVLNSSLHITRQGVVQILVVCLLT